MWRKYNVSTITRVSKISLWISPALYSVFPTQAFWWNSLEGIWSSHPCQEIHMAGLLSVSNSNRNSYQWHGSSQNGITHQSKSYTQLICFIISEDEAWQKGWDVNQFPSFLPTNNPPVISLEDLLEMSRTTFSHGWPFMTVVSVLSLLHNDSPACDTLTFSQDGDRNSEQIQVIFKPAEQVLCLFIEVPAICQCVEPYYGVISHSCQQSLLQFFFY